MFAVVVVWFAVTAATVVQLVPLFQDRATVIVFVPPHAALRDTPVSTTWSPVMLPEIDSPAPIGPSSPNPPNCCVAAFVFVCA